MNIQEIFKAQVQNVNLLNQARKQLKRTINRALRTNDLVAVKIYTKVFALVYCSWVEVNFSKVIHTPYGFSNDEINQIKRIYQRKGLEAGWKKCIELGLRKINKASKSNYIPNVKRKVLSYVKNYIIEPSLIRNKIAHGQWKVALNEKSTAINTNLTEELKSLNVINVSNWFNIYRHILNIIEDIIASPKKAFHRDYNKHIIKLEDYLKKMSSLTLKKKKELLRKKPLKYNKTE